MYNVFNLFSDDFSNMMLGYKLQLRSGLRINQRRTQTLASHSGTVFLRKNKVIVTVNAALNVSCEEQVNKKLNPPPNTGAFMSR